MYFLKPSSTQRIINHSINQFKEGKKISLFSYRHELHFVTAYNIFKDNIFFGAGLKSFRLLCDKDKFVPIDKILTDNSIKSPTDGFVYKKIVNNDIFVIITKKAVNSEELELTFDNKSLFYYVITPDKQLVKFYKENGDSVHKDEPIFAAYDFKNGCNTHPHNILFQFLSELGLVGLLFLFVAFYFLIKKISLIIIKKIKNKNLPSNEHLLFFTLLGLSLNLFPLFPSGNFFNNWLSVVFYFYVGFLIYTLKKNKL